MKKNTVFVPVIALAEAVAALERRRPGRGRRRGATRRWIAGVSCADPVAARRYGKYLKPPLASAAP